MHSEWQTTAPPNEQVVEVELGGQILQVMAFYGRDGYRPHWKTIDGSQCWDVAMFDKWRAV